MMTKMKIYKLHFKSPLHLGDSRDDYSVSQKTISSDTMYAALTSCLAKLGESIPENGDLNCTISDLFPFFQKEENSEATYFLPKPLFQKIPKLKEIRDAKKVKKVSWFDINYFEKLINGVDTFSNNFDTSKINDIYLSDNTDFILLYDKKLKEEEKGFIFSEVSPRVQVSRSGQDNAEPFYMDRIYFKSNSGLYFIVDGDTSLIDKAMNLLQHEGIGTDRNVGNGFFEYSKDEISINCSENTNNLLSLSTFIPESKEQLEKLLDNENVAYDLMRRGGWITTPPNNTIRKNSIYTFKSGSVFYQENAKQTILGKIVNLKPEIDSVKHPIWRNGKSIFIPIKI